MNFLKHNVIKVKKKKKRKHERQVSDINMLSFEKNETITNDHAKSLDFLERSHYFL